MALYAFISVSLIGCFKRFERHIMRAENENAHELLEFLTPTARERESAEAIVHAALGNMHVF